MVVARLKLGPGETELTRDVTTVGRTADNDIAVDDTNVSRAHVEIERRGDDYYLIDLGSSNGTTVNGQPVRGEVRLESGDKIVFGNSAEAEFLVGSPTVDAESQGSDALETPGLSQAQSELGSLGNEAQSAAESAVLGGINNAASPVAATSTGSNPMVLVAGAVCGVAVVCAIAAGAFYATRGSSACEAKASIVSPETGDTINAVTVVQLSVTSGECVARAIVKLDGEPAASADAPAFEASIDPAEHPSLADGIDHALTVTLVDEAGKEFFTSAGTPLAFETRKVTPPSTPVVANANTQPVKPTSPSAVTLLQVQQMSQAFTKQFASGSNYNISNRQFLQEVQKRAAEYTAEGMTQRAAVYRDAINSSFVREQNLDAALGFVLAMSRSKFAPAKQGDSEGLWQMSSAFVSDNKYNGQCGTQTLSDPTQTCAASAAAIYLKAIVFGVFEGDAIYSAAAFGKSAQDAATWKASLPANRADIGAVVKTPAEREQLVRFFAAGIVAENPQKFGLKDKPLSTLYPQ